jgi:hypothetical protein
LLGAHTPSKNPPAVCRYKHTSLAFLVVAFYELRLDGLLRSSPPLALLPKCKGSHIELEKTVHLSDTPALSQEYGAFVTWLAEAA